MPFQSVKNFWYSFWKYSDLGLSMYLFQITKFEDLTPKYSWDIATFVKLIIIEIQKIYIFEIMILP